MLFCEACRALLRDVQGCFAGDTGLFCGGRTCLVVPRSNLNHSSRTPCMVPLERLRHCAEARSDVTSATDNATEPTKFTLPLLHVCVCVCTRGCACLRVCVRVGRGCGITQRRGLMSSLPHTHTHAHTHTHTRTHTHIHTT